MRFEGTSTRVPVFGLRPTRGCRCRVRKLPYPRISILSPARSERTILSKIASTITSESLRVISTTRETSSIKSALVMVSLLLQFILRELAFAVSTDIDDLFDGHRGGYRLALIIFQACSFFVFSDGLYT